MNTDLKIIKKKYGEKMMHFCRDAFPGLLEEEGKLSHLLLEHFEPNHELYIDLVENKKLDDFKRYVNNLLVVKEENIKTNKTPKELLDEAGYILYECKTEKDIQKFKKYYEPHEELCTFNGGRLNSCHVFFAVKKNVNEIKREDFKNPERQDLYGTSVISIQFSRKGHYLSIKNRYNHTVANPDATFSNNLDNIINGLTDSFIKYYKLNPSNKNNAFEIYNYVNFNDKYYKYNYEINNKYYCPNNIIIDKFEVKQYEKEKYIVMDYFLLDLQNKEIKLYDQDIQDAFVDNFGNIKDIKITITNESKTIFLIVNNVETIEIELDKENNIIGYKNNSIVNIKNRFLSHNHKLKTIECQNLRKIGDYFLYFNKNLTELSLPKVEEISNNFLEFNYDLKDLYLPNVKKIGNNFLLACHSLGKLILLKVKKIGNNFMSGCCGMYEFILPNVEFIGSNFLSSNNKVTSINLPKVLEIQDEFMMHNEKIDRIDMPLLKKIGQCFLLYNKKLKENIFA